MHFSAFTEFGLDDFTGEAPLAERIYEALWSNLTGGGRVPNYSKNGYTDAKVYATAMALARWLATAQRLDAQIDPDTVLELLTEREWEHGLVVPANATIAERRAALKAAMAAVPAEGWTFGTMQQALVDLLGSAFVDLRQLPGSSIVNTPADPSPGPGNFAAPSVQRKIFRLKENASTFIGSSWNWAYEHLDGSAPTDAEALAEGELVVIEPEHNTRRERCVVEDDLGLDNTGVRAAAFTFTKTHHAGALITTQPWPYWVSTRCHWIVQLTAAAAVDAETRRRVDELMARMSHATSTWQIQGDDTPFLLDTSPLDVTPLS
jgi:hypothetical protein